MSLSKSAGKTNSENYDSAVIVALGSNLSIFPGAPSDILIAALDEFQQSGLEVVRRSSFWCSAAWPDPSEPDYINAVAVVETSLSPEAALARLHALEARFGRVRGRANAPRTLDLDLIAYGRLLRPDAPALPHPRAAERLFVMGPLAEIAPGWVHPANGRTAAELARHASVGCDARPLPD
ncbi:MAG: 2-amino-4-hydroxy-6-hydroxymethyldihydropteridine diphosphokinase [Caulobacteraceae bacterium]